MKKALLAIAAMAVSASVFAQSSDGTLVFKSLGVQNAAGTGTYNVPIFASNGDNIQNGVAVGYTGNTTQGNSAVGGGSLPSGVTIGLFLSSNLASPIATGQLGTANAGVQPYIITPAPAQTISVPGQPPGATPSLTIRAWQTSDGSFAASQARNGGQWGEWVITSKPLGGTPAGGGTPITPPTLTGWGAETGTGFELNQTVPEPTTIALSVLGIGALVLARRRK
jgi:hypothetical protein